MEVVVPDLGDFSDVEIIEVFVKPGDSVSVEDPLVTLETDKAAMDVPAPAAGVLREVSVSVGDRVSSGDVIGQLDAADADDSAGENAGTDAAEAADSDTAETDSAEADSAEADGEKSGDGDADGAPDEASDASGGRKDGTSSSGPDKAAADAEPTTVVVPDLGDFSDVEIIDVLVAAGDDVEAEQGLVTLETDKAAMDVPAPEAGRIVELKVEVGSRVSSGSEIAVLKPAGGRAASADTEDAEAAAGRGAGDSAPRDAAADAGTPAAAPKREARSAAARPGAAVDERRFSQAHASPSVRKLARELGVDLGRVEGSGRKGRVTDEDVKAFVKSIMTGTGGAGLAWPAVPDVDFARFGEVDVQPLTRIQKISGPRLHASWVNLPHVTQHDEADITELESTRQELKDQAAERGIRLTPLAFILRALALTLEEFERFKSSLSADGESLVLKKYMHIGFAADTPNGLVVPVIRDADRKDVYELATALAEISQRARDGKLKSDDLQGGVFTVSSLGGIGGTFFTPIINAPEVAILGISKTQTKPVWNGVEFVPRLMLPLSLSYDHRVIDGAEAVRFTTRLGEVLADIDRIMEAIP